MIKEKQCEMPTFFVQRDKIFDKIYRHMLCAGGSASLAAANTTAIIKKLEQKGEEGLCESCRRTKHGEKRLKNCYKFNLGNGYRLVSVKKNNVILLLFIGTHDECDAWLEKNRGRDFFSETGDMAWETTDGQVDHVCESDDNVEEDWCIEDEYEEILMDKINDKALAQLFCGLRKRCV